MNNANLKWLMAAKLALIVLNIFVLLQFVSMYQTEYQLVSPLVPRDIIWEINRNYAFMAFCLVVVNIIALLLFYWRKYIAVVILIAVAILASGYIYI